MTLIAAEWAGEYRGIDVLRRVAAAAPSAELTGAEGAQLDEEDMGMSYDELGVCRSLKPFFCTDTQPFLCAASGPIATLKEVVIRRIWGTVAKSSTVDHYRAFSSCASAGMMDEESLLQFVAGRTGRRSLQRSRKRGQSTKRWHKRSKISTSVRF